MENTVTIMKIIISRCGYRCDLCLAYKENVHSKEDQKRTSDGWFKYYGFRIPPEEIWCDGCLTPDDQKPKLMDPECLVRPCVLEKQLENCAYCDQYICSKLKTRIVEYDSIVAKFEEDYENFIKPYEARKVLEGIRKIQVAGRKNADL